MNVKGDLAGPIAVVGEALGARSLGGFVQVMFLPQCAVTPPGASLAGQLTYGSGGSSNPHDLRRALRQVGLGQLLRRVDGDWLLSRPWTGAPATADPTARIPLLQSRAPSAPISKILTKFCSMLYANLTVDLAIMD